MRQFKIIEPLSNFQIIELCKKLKITNFKGCFMRNELLGMKRTSDESMILNLDDNSGRGTHWTCLLIKNSEAYYFDPFGMSPTAELQVYLKDMQTYYNSFKIQGDKEEICGHYCLYVLWRLTHGISFYNVCYELLK